jgi:hypothetical protein
MAHRRAAAWNFPEANTLTARSHSAARAPRLCALIASAALLVGGSAAASAAPAPTLPHVVVVQPDTDSVSVGDYTAGVPVTVQVMRGDVVVATSQPVTPVSDGQGGTIAEFNAVGALAATGCWQAITPDIRFGDTIRVIQGTTIEDTTVQHLTIDTVPAVDPGDPASVFFTGTAASPTGTRLDQAGLEALILNQSFSGRPFIRVPGDPGTIGYVPLIPVTNTSWTATFTNLVPGDVAAAVVGSPVISWTSGSGAEVTEVGLLDTPGPQAPCTSPLVTEGITGVTPGAFIHNTTELTIQGIAADDVTHAQVSISDTNPFTADVVTPVQPITSVGGGASWNMTIPRANLLALSDGQLTITPTFTAGTQRVGPNKIITKNMTIPDTTAPIASLVSGPPSFTQTTTATFTFASNEPGTFECRLDAAAFAPCNSPTVVIALAEGPHTFTFRAKDGSGNLSPDVVSAWQVDRTPPRASAKITAARRALLTSTGRMVASMSCSERCSLVVEARFTMPGASPGRARIVRSLTIARGATGLVRGTLTPAQLGALRRSLAAGHKVRISFNITATDRAGNRRVTHPTVTLTRADLR